MLNLNPRKKSLRKTKTNWKMPPVFSYRQDDPLRWCDKQTNYQTLQPTYTQCTTLHPASWSLSCNILPSFFYIYRPPYLIITGFMNKIHANPTYPFIVSSDIIIDIFVSVNYDTLSLYNLWFDKPVQFYSKKLDFSRRTVWSVSSFLLFNNFRDNILSRLLCDGKMITWLHAVLLNEKLNPSMHFMVEVVLKLWRNSNNLQILYFVLL